MEGVEIDSRYGFTQTWKSAPPPSATSHYIALHPITKYVSLSHNLLPLLYAGIVSDTYRVFFFTGTPLKR